LWYLLSEVNERPGAPDAAELPDLEVTDCAALARTALAEKHFLRWAIRLSSEPTGLITGRITSLSKYRKEILFYDFIDFLLH
jgi:hypothetical protein